MSMSREELLRPSLSSGVIAKAPYSVRATFLTAFFGGSVAAIAITAVNSGRLRRFRRDLAVLALMLVAVLVFRMALIYTDWGRGFVVWLTELAGTRGLAYFDRLLGLALFGLGYALHRKEQRGADFVGLERPNGWLAGLACIGFSIAFTVVFILATGLDARRP
jgi:hypothetical protein